MALNRQSGLGNEGLQNVFILKNIISKRVNMKADGGFYIAKRVFIGVAFPNNDAFKSKWIGYISIRVFFDNNFDYHN